MAKFLNNTGLARLVALIKQALGGKADKTELPLVVTFTGVDDNISCDTSIADIYAAYSGGRVVVAHMDEDLGEQWELLGCNTTVAAFSAFIANNQVTVVGTNNGTSDSWSVSYTEYQTALTFDSAPTAGSSNPVTSGGVKTALDGKQATLVSGTNIKTVCGSSILGSGDLQLVADDIYTGYGSVEDALNAKQDTLVSGTNIKTVNNNSLLGSGNVDLGGGDILYLGKGKYVLENAVDSSIDNALDDLDNAIHELGTPNEIARITATESQTSGGNNVVTITETNGTTTSFNVKNGKDGKDGQDGQDGADGVSLGEVALVQTAGDSEESVMSQKAVTDELFFDYSMNAYDDVIWETGLITTSNGKNGTNVNQRRTQGYLDLGAETTSVTIETNGEFYAFFYNENDEYLGYRYLNKTSVEVTKTTYPTMRKVRFCSVQNYGTKYYRKNLIIKCSHYELLPTAVKQTTGASFGSLMSQKAITDAINRNINVVNCSCGFLASSNTYRIKLTDEQYDALQNTDVMSITIVMTEPENAYSASMTLRYVNVYGNGSAASTSNGFLIEWDYSKRMFCAHKNYNTATCVNRTSGGTIINPLVFTIIWDKAEGTVRYYERATLISTQTYDEYKISNFVSSDKTISVNGGDTAIYLYDLQIFNDDISKRGFSLYQNTIYGASYVYAKYDGNINTTAVDWITINGDWSTYGTASGFTCTYPGDGTCVITSSGSTAWLNRGYYLGSSTQIQRWEVDIEVISGECKVSSNGQVITAIIDGNGDNHASGSLLGVGTYTIKGYSDGSGKWRIAYGSGDLKVIHYRNRYKYVSCVVHLKCDNYYDGALYDEQGKCFYDFNTTLKPNSTPFTLPRVTTDNPPNYAGQMAIPSNGNIYIGTKNYVWKQINNS